MESFFVKMMDKEGGGGVKKESKWMQNQEAWNIQTDQRLWKDSSV